MQRIGISYENKPNQARVMFRSQEIIYPVNVLLHYEMLYRIETGKKKKKNIEL